MNTKQLFFLELILPCLLSGPLLCHGQGTFTINFDGPPLIPPGTARFVQQYYESGLWFRPLGVVGPGNGFVRRGSNPSSGWPDDGSAYVQAGFGDSLMFSFTDGSIFAMHSVDLAGFSDVVPNVTAYFTGYRSDGSTVSVSFPASGLALQTFNFGPEFTGLTRVESPSFGSLDNLVIFVPEPGSCALVLLGASFLAMRTIKRGHKGQYGRSWSGSARRKLPGLDFTA